MSLRTAIVVGVLAAGCVTGRGADSPSSRFRLQIAKAQLVEDDLDVEYVLTNDSQRDAWVACTEFECEIPGTWFMRLDDVSGDGTLLRLSSRVVPEENGPFTTWPEWVPFRRIPPCDTRSKASFPLRKDAARTLAGTRDRVDIELSIAVLPCPDAHLLPPFMEGTDVHLAVADLVLDCSGQRVSILDVQQLATATHVLLVRRERHTGDERR